MGSLSKMEEWLYEDGFYVTNATDFENRLDELHMLVGPILRRAKELEFRDQLPELVEKVREEDNAYQYRSGHNNIFCSEWYWRSEVLSLKVLLSVNQTVDYVKRNMTW
eukprot:5799480-Amphidinium_carterae.1